MISSGLSIQRTLAEELHNLANVPLRQCDLNDVKTFQSALPGYQINIVSKESFNAIVYQGPEAEKMIYLYHHDNHYDVITTMSGFLHRSYFCQKCQKGFNTKEKHICNETKEGGAFTDNVNTFLKMKQEASGWPKWCNTEEDRYKYIE